MASALLVTDLDGTLLDANGRISDANREALQRVGQRGVVRAVATGRSLHSLKQGLGMDAPIDYAIFSTGAGAVRWQPDGLDTVLLARGLCEADTRLATNTAVAQGMNVMVLAPVPDSHHIAYVRSHDLTDCLRVRIEKLQPHCRELAMDEHGAHWQGPSCQILALPPPGDPAQQHRSLAAALPDLHIVRTTSPHDPRAVWLEVFPSDVSKGTAAQWLADRCGIAASDTHAVGNDYNDLDMLEWAAHAAVVANAPDALRARFQTLAHHDHNAIANAIERFRL